MNLEDERRYHMITEGEYKRRKAKEMRRAEKDQEQCKENMTICAQLVFCWFCSSCLFEDKTKRCLCAASLSGIQYGGIATGVAANNASSLGLGIGISAIVLGAVTGIGLCVNELRASESSSQQSAPIEVQPGVTVGPPAIIYQPH